MDCSFAGIHMFYFTVVAFKYLKSPFCFHHGCRTSTVHLASYDGAYGVRRTASMRMLEALLHTTTPFRKKAAYTRQKIMQHFFIIITYM